MFEPDKEITRQEMVTLLYNTLEDIGKLPEGSAGKTLTDFSDAEQISSWAENAMTLFVGTGTINGSGNNLFPGGSTTRAEMAGILYNLMNN